MKSLLLILTLTLCFAVTIQKAKAQSVITVTVTQEDIDNSDFTQTGNSLALAIRREVLGSSGVTVGTLSARVNGASYSYDIPVLALLALESLRIRPSEPYTATLTLSLVVLPLNL